MLGIFRTYIISVLYIMYCDLCNETYDNYYYKKHLKTKKHIIELNKLKNKVDNEEFINYITTCKINAKNKTYKITDKYITITRGTFIISL